MENLNISNNDHLARLRLEIERGKKKHEGTDLEGIGLMLSTLGTMIEIQFFMQEVEGDYDANMESLKQTRIDQELLDLGERLYHEGKFLKNTSLGAISSMIRALGDMVYTLAQIRQWKGMMGQETPPPGGQVSEFPPR